MLRGVDDYLRTYDLAAQARTRHGVTHAVRTSDLIQRYLYLFGVWEPNLTRWIAGRLRPGDGFIDVGANIGYYALLAAKKVQRRGYVVAVEPSPVFARQLADAAKKNAAKKNVRVINCAASDGDRDEQPFYEAGQRNRGATSMVRPQGAPDEPAFRASTATLATLLTGTEIRGARLVKIDVEGAEADVLAGFRPVLAMTRPDLEIVVEISPALLAQFGHTPRDVVEPLRAAGFHCYRVDHRWRPEAYLRPYTPPQRFEGPITEQGDFVFSRVDSDSL